MPDVKLVKEGERVERGVPNFGTSSLKLAGPSVLQYQAGSWAWHSLGKEQAVVVDVAAGQAITGAPESSGRTNEQCHRKFVKRFHGV